MSNPLSLEERLELGRHQRKHMRRIGHAEFDARLRKETPLQLLKTSYRGRIPSLEAMKNQRMAVSPFAFFRGAVPLMAYDLSLAPNTGLHTQLCGDAHVSNLGAYEGPAGELLFDINDFDETIQGPFEWDVKRMATSLILAGTTAGASDKQCQEGVSQFLRTYRECILRFAPMPVMEMARYQVHRIKRMQPVSQLFLMAQRSTPIHTLQNLTEIIASGVSSSSHSKTAAHRGKHAAKHPFPGASSTPQRLFRPNPPVLTRLTGLAAQSILDSLHTYAKSLLPERRRFLARYRPLDVAMKIVGTGSVGLRDYCIYLEGNTPYDPLFLQIKEETKSAYVPYLGNNPAAPHHEGRRVVEGERSMQLQSDPFLGWTTVDGRDYLVRQINDHKASIDIAELKSEGLFEYATVCGEILARGHSRGGDAALIAGYIGTSTRFDEAILRFAISYALQTEIDWKHFVHATHTSARSSSKKAGMKKRAKSASAQPGKSKARADAKVAMRSKGKD